MNNILEKIYKVVKLVLFISMLVLSYMATDKVVDYISTLDIVLIKRVVNIIIIVVFGCIYFKKDDIKKSKKEITTKH